MGFDLGISGKTAFVTGGASGIGEVVCRTLADRNIQQALRLSGELNDAGKNTIAVELDVSDYGATKDAVDRTVKQFGTLHLAVNNAGIATPRGILHEQSIEDWDLCMAVNLTGVFYCMRAQIPHMLLAGKGSIVNLSSICGVIAVNNTSAYKAAKHSVAGLSKTAGLDYAEKGIRINAVAHGYVDTPLMAVRSAEEHAAVAERHPMQRMATPQEITNMIIFLLSERAGFITGSLQLVDGGYTAR